MGVPKLFRYLRRLRIAGIDIRPVNVYSAWMDLNGIIHTVAAYVYGYGIEDDIERQKRLAEIAAMPSKGRAKALQNLAFKLIFDEIVLVVNELRVTELLYIAIDGVAPVAKMVQQRLRRYITAVYRSSGEYFDSNAINPGTKFMYELDIYLGTAINNHESELCQRVIYAGPDVIGEGEHKIIDAFRGMISDGTLPRDRGAHVIYGLDADLIILAMLLPITEMYILRDYGAKPRKEKSKITTDTAEGVSAVQTVIANKTKRPMRHVRFQYVNIDLIKAEMQRRMQTTAENSIHDFVVMTSLIGNDFLPRSPALLDMDVTVDRLIETYVKAKTPLTARIPRVVNKRVADEIIQSETTNDYDIYWPGMREFVKHLAQLEPQWLAEEAVRPVFKHSIAFAKALSVPNPGAAPVFDYELFSNVYYAIELGRGGAPFDEQGVVEMALNYAETIAWVFRYYTKGLAYVNFDHHYRFNYAPLLVDFHSAMNIYDMTDELDKYREPEKLDILAYDHLLMVLPVASKKLLPGVLANLMLQKGMPRYSSQSVEYGGYQLPGITAPSAAPSPIAWYYPQAFIREWLAIDDADEYRREIIPILPNMDLDAVKAATDTVEISEKVLARFKPGVVHDKILPYPLADVKLGRAARDLLIQQTTESLRAAVSRRGRGGGQPSDAGRGQARGQVAERGGAVAPQSGRGQGSERGRGQFRGRGQATERGRGQAPQGGRGQFTERGRGQFTERGRGQFTERGRGQSRGAGQFAERGRGQGRERGEGQGNAPDPIRAQASSGWRSLPSFVRK